MQSFQPDFSYIEKVLTREPVDRPVLFEFFMNDHVYRSFAAPRNLPEKDRDLQDRVLMIDAFVHAGYDYATLLPGSEFFFPHTGEDHGSGRTYSLNTGSHLDSWERYEDYPWPDAETADISYAQRLIPYLHEGMKLIASGPGGLEEIVISLTGYENLCFMMHDQSELVDALFDAVGSRLVSYYRRISAFDHIGACISNDDWGFNTQTLLSPKQMERWVFPWHKRIADTVHEAGKPVILHSCGNIYSMFHRVTEYIGYDGKHSYEDSILPVEQAWERYHDQIAVLGGIDMNFMIMEDKKTIYNRSRALLEQTAEQGGFALGTGNSVPDYLPTEQFIAMLQAAWDLRK